MSLKSHWHRIWGSRLGQTAAANLAIVFVSGLIAVLSGRLFEPEERGALAAAVVWSAFACALADVGMSDASAYFGAQRPFGRGRIVGTILACTLGLGTVSGLAVWLAASPMVTDALGPAMAIYALSIPAALANTGLVNLCQGEGRARLFNVFRVLRPCTHLVPLLLAAAGSLSSVESVLLGAATLEWGLFVGALVAIAGRSPMCEWRTDRDSMGQMLNYGFKAYPGNLSWIANARLDQMLLSFLLPLNLLGVYAVAASYAGVLFSLASSFGMSNYGRLAGAGAAGVGGELSSIARRMVLPVGLAGALMAAASPWTIPLLFGDSFRAAVAPAAFLVLGTALLSYNYVASMALRATGSPEVASTAEAMGLALTTAGLLALLPLAGLMGAVAVSIAAPLLVGVMLRRFLRQRSLSSRGQRPRAKSRVLVFVDYYLPGYKAGGPIQSVSRLIATLKSEFEFWVFTRDRDLGDSTPYPEVEPGAWSTQNGAPHFYASPNGLGSRSVLRAVRECRPDVIYLNSYFSRLTRAVLWLRLLGKLNGIAVLVAPRGEFSPGALRLRGFKKAAYLKVATVLGLHRRLVWQVSSARELSDTRAVIQGDPRCFIKAPDVMLSLRAAETRPRRPKAKGAVRLVFVSRISPMKNLLAAIEMLDGIDGEIELDVFGPAEDAAYWRQCREALDELPGNIRWRHHGSIPPHQVAKAFGDADFFLFPTLGENYGHVISEALAAGCPILLSDQTPWHDLEEKGAGWVMPLKDQALWHKTIQDCVDMGPEDHREMSEAALRFIRQFAESSMDLDANRAMFDSVLEFRQLRAA